MKSYVILFDGRRPLESSIKKDSGFLMDVNNSMRKRFFPVMFYCFFYPQDLAFQNVMYSPEQWKGLSPKRNAMTALSLFVQ